MNNRMLMVPSPPKVSLLELAEWAEGDSPSPPVPPREAVMGFVRAVIAGTGQHSPIEDDGEPALSDAMAAAHLRLIEEYYWPPTKETLARNASFAWWPLLRWMEKWQ